MAAFADTATRVDGIGFIREKESDRVAGPVTELRRAGVDAEEHEDGFVVRPAGRPGPAVFDTYEDHRMAMAFSLVGLVVPGVAVRDPGCVAKTFLLLRGFGTAAVSGQDVAMRVIAIDGPAGSGKSTVARALAAHLGLRYLDTGAMYRAVAFAVLRSGGDPEDAAATAATARRVDLDIGLDAVIVDGGCTVEIRGQRSAALSVWWPPIRRSVRNLSRQRKGESARWWCAGGADIGTVVFRDAELKVSHRRPRRASRRRAKEVTDLDYETVAGHCSSRWATPHERPIRWSRCRCHRGRHNRLDIGQVVDHITTLFDASTDPTSEEAESMTAAATGPGRRCRPALPTDRARACALRIPMRSSSHLHPAPASS